MGKTYRKNDTYSNKYSKFVSKKKLKGSKPNKFKPTEFDQPPTATFDDYDPTAQ